MKRAPLDLTLLPLGISWCSQSVREQRDFAAVAMTGGRGRELSHSQKQMMVITEVQGESSAVLRDVSSRTENPWTVMKQRVPRRFTRMFSGLQELSYRCRSLNCFFSSTKLFVIKNPKSSGHFYLKGCSCSSRNSVVSVAFRPISRSLTFCTNR